MMAVAVQGAPPVARLLVDCGADVNGHKGDRWTSLHLASHKGQLDTAKLLIDHGANVDMLTAGTTTRRLPWTWHRGMGTSK
jgi:ankyrin repeat protein